MGSSSSGVSSIFPITPTGSARAQSERGLDLPEPRGSGEGRASGKSDGKRSDRRETSGGSCAGLLLCCLDSRRLSVRRKPNVAERLSKGLSRRVRGCVVRGWLL